MLVMSAFQSNSSFQPLIGWPVPLTAVNWPWAPPVHCPVKTKSAAIAGAEAQSAEAARTRRFTSEARVRGIARLSCLPPLPAVPHN